MITLPAVTLALALTNPVQVSSCSISQETTTTSSGDSPNYEIIGSLLNIRFVNGGTTPVSSVSFAVTEDGKTSTILDRGTFSPGVTISHTFRNEPFAFEASCRVQSVLFADGSAWMAPNDRPDPASANR
ncbi:MAG TPA: hypothetical protein VMG98_00835 [Verrucomicrobiae bacterium]|nr:hypothetical protein [Verrucomicrobiae bacterium]